MSFRSAPPRLDEEQAAPSTEQTLHRLFLTLFLRGRGARGLRRQTAPKSVVEKLWLTLGIYTLMGFMALFFLRQTVFALGVYLHCLTFALVGMFVAASSGELLFNKEESDILLHRPISTRMLLWAKVRVLAEVSLWMGGALNLACFFVGMFVPDGHAWFPFVHALSTAMEALFCTGCVVVGYQLCLRWFGRERLEGLMTTAQVLVAVAAVLSGQILPRLVFRDGALQRLDPHAWWIVLLPPAWFAGLDDAASGTGEGSSWVLAAIGVAATAAVLALAFGQLARSYQSGLQRMGETAAPVKRGGRRRWIDALAGVPPLSWILRDPIARASFVLTGAYLFRDRDVKLRVYPGLAPVLVMPVAIFFSDINHSGRHGAFSGMMLSFVALYLALVPAIAINLLQFSQQWQAGDVFRVAPMSGPAPLCRGARWAVWIFLTLPLIIAYVAVILLLHPAGMDWPLLLPGALAIPVCTLFANLNGSGIPLSQATEEAKSVGRGLWMIGAMLIAGAIGGLALWARKAGWFWPFMATDAGVMIALYISLSRSLTTTPWPSLE